MAILGAIPVLNCHSIDASLSFYTQLLQFVVVNKREREGRLDWVHLMHGETTLMLQVATEALGIQAAQPSGPSSEDAPSNIRQSPISLYFFVTDIKDLHHFVKAKNNSVSALKETDYRMQEFSMSDPEGNTVTFGQKN